MQDAFFPDGSGERLLFHGAIELSILVPGSVTNGAFAIFEDIVQPNVGPPRHIHTEQDEVFSILEGTFDFEVGGRPVSATAGDLAYVPRGSVHAFKNIGDEPGRLRYKFTPAGTMEEMFRALHVAADIGDITPEQMTQIAARHDQAIVGGPM